MSERRKINRGRQLLVFLVVTGFMFCYVKSTGLPCLMGPDNLISRASGTASIGIVNTTCGTEGDYGTTMKRPIFGDVTTCENGTLVTTFKAYRSCYHTAGDGHIASCCVISTDTSKVAMGTAGCAAPEGATTIQDTCDTLKSKYKIELAPWITTIPADAFPGGASQPLCRASSGYMNLDIGGIDIVDTGKSTTLDLATKDSNGNYVVSYDEKTFVGIQQAIHAAVTGDSLYSAAGGWSAGAGSVFDVSTHVHVSSVSYSQGSGAFNTSAVSSLRKLDEYQPRCTETSPNFCAATINYEIETPTGTQAQVDSDAKLLKSILEGSDFKATLEANLKTKVVSAGSTLWTISAGLRVNTHTHRYFSGYKQGREISTTTAVLASTTTSDAGGSSVVSGATTVTPASSPAGSGAAGTTASATTASVSPASTFRADDVTSDTATTATATAAATVTVYRAEIEGSVLLSIDASTILTSDALENDTKFVSSVKKGLIASIKAADSSKSLESLSESDIEITEITVSSAPDPATRRSLSNVAGLVNDGSSDDVSEKKRMLQSAQSVAVKYKIIVEAADSNTVQSLQASVDTAVKAVTPDGMKTAIQTELTANPTTLVPAESLSVTSVEEAVTTAPEKAAATTTPSTSVTTSVGASTAAVTTESGAYGGVVVGGCAHLMAVVVGIVGISLGLM